MAAPNWIKLESDPEVITNLLHKIGVPDKYAVLDVLGFEPDVLSLVPKSTVGLILLTPESGPGEGIESPCDLYWMKQTVRSACGTIALIHAVVNSGISLEEGSILDKFVSRTRGLSPEEKGQALGEDVEFAAAHEAAAKEGLTPTEGESYNTPHHYIAFVQTGGKLYEMTGTRVIDHGASSADTFVSDAAKVCQQKIEQIKVTNDSQEYGAVAISKVK